MNTPLKIYIAGKVSGEPIATCTIKFGTAQKELEALGHVAVNPLELVGDFKAPWGYAMRKCIKGLMDCDAILLLPCHENSEGARLELMLAEKTHLLKFYSIKNVSDFNKHLNHIFQNSPLHEK